MRRMWRGWRRVSGGVGANGRISRDVQMFNQGSNVQKWISEIEEVTIINYNT